MYLLAKQASHKHNLNMPRDLEFARDTSLHWSASEVDHYLDGIYKANRNAYRIAQGLS